MAYPFEGPKRREIIIPEIDWMPHLTKAIKNVKPGDVIVVENEQRKELAKIAAKELGKEGVGILVIRKEALAAINRATGSIEDEMSDLTSLNAEVSTPLDSIQAFDAIFSSKKVTSWESLEIKEPIAFRELGVRALRKLDKDSVPTFDKKKHLEPEYTGFVEKLVVFGPSDYQGHPLEEADCAYIKGGKIVYTQKTDSQLSSGRETTKVSWRDDSFRIDEKYELIDFPRNITALLTTRKKTAEFVLKESHISIEAELDQTNTLHVYIKENTENPLFADRAAVAFVLNLNDPQNFHIVTMLQSDAKIFSDWDKTWSLFTKGGLLLKRPTRKVPYATFEFQDAIAKAFPNLVKQ